MTRRLLPLALLAVAFPAAAQSTGLRGFVTGADDSQPLIGATVLVAASSGAATPAAPRPTSTGSTWSRG